MAAPANSIFCVDVPPRCREGCAGKPHFCDTDYDTDYDTENDTAESRCTKGLRAYYDTDYDTDYDTERDTHY